MRTFLPPIALFVVASSLACSSTPGTGSDGGAEAGTSLLGFTPSNIGHALDGVDTSKLVDIDITSANGEITVSCGGEGNGGCFETTITQPDQTQIDVYFARSWRIEPNSITIANDSKPVVIVALTTIEILGKLDASAQGLSEGAGGFKGTTTNGGGKGGGSAGSGASNTPGVGGGGAAFCGAGGAGGNASGSAGQGGTPYGTAELVPLVAGSGGGGSALFGGGSGGAIQLVAGTSITIDSTGVVAAGGGGGYSGNGNGTGQAGAGGGSGGALLLEAPNVTIAGTLAVNGGGGGGGSGSPDNQAGADATANGQIAAGGNPSTTGAGGNGGAGSTKAGTAGAAGDTTTGTNAAGGGGGGAGYIRINSKSGAATVSGTLSPALDSTCATQGTLAP